MAILSVERTCAEIHRLFDLLPAFREPMQVFLNNGLYFFYERGETSLHAVNGRIVRIGNHPRSPSGLLKRLRLHYSGNKNASVFRKFLGGALIRRKNHAHPCLSHWERQGQATCVRCKPIEREVSAVLRSDFWFRCVEIGDRELRNDLEKKLIATISLCHICKPSETWLGQYAYSETVRHSGLWNSDYVFDSNLLIQGKDLEILERLVAITHDKRW